MTTRSRKARSKTECNIVRCFRTDAADRPFPVVAVAAVTQALYLCGQNLAHRPVAEGGGEVLVEEDRYPARVEVSTCLDLSRTVSTSLLERDLATGIVVPCPVADLLVLP